MQYTSEVLKKDWPSGLFCVGCGRRILYGRNAVWDTAIGAPEAYHEECK